MLKPFEILAPGSLDEACDALAEYGSAAAVYAGGTELLLLMKEGLVHFPLLIDIKRIPGLAEISANDRTLHVGAAVTHRQLEHSRAVRARLEAFSRVESQVANVRVRAVGTLGGNLCFGEPHSDPATFILALGGELELASASGRRTILVDDFFLGLFETARRPDEILAAVHLPLPAPGVGIGYEKFSLHERPSATAAAVVAIEDGRIKTARLAAGSVGPRPVRITGAEELLPGEPPSAELFAEAGSIVAREVEPVDDLYGSSEYKRHLIAGLSARALEKASTTAAGKSRGGA